MLSASETAEINRMLVRVKNEALLVELDCKVLVAVCELNWMGGHWSHTDAVCTTEEKKQTKLRESGYDHY